MGPIFLRFVVALFALLPRLAAADPGALHLARVSDEALQVRPGEVISVAFVLQGADRTVTETLVTPPGWAAATPVGSLPLRADRPRTRIIALKVGADTPAGPYTFSYAVASDDGARARTEVRVEVARVTGLVLEVAPTPEFVRAGDPVEVTLRVTNVGNAPERVSLQAAPEAGLRAVLPVDRIDLPPRATTEVALRVDTRRDEDRPTERIVRVAATSGAARDEAVVILSLVPRSERLDAVRRYPLRASVVATTDGHDVAIQPVAEGRAPVDADGAWVVDLLLRGPDARSTGAFAQQDEYRVGLQGPYGGVGLGDRVYALSPLTTPGRYGRGGEAQLRAGPVHAGAWYAMDRFASEPGGTLGASAGVRVDEGAAVGLQLLRRFGGDEALLTSLLAEVPVFGDSRVGAEVAMDATNVRPALASRLEAVARLPKDVSLTLLEVAAAPDHRGQERDVHRTQGTLAVPFGRRLAVRGSFAREERNLARSPSLGEAPLAHRGDVQIAWSAPSAWSVEGGLAAATREDLLGEGAWQEGAARLHVARGVPRLYLGLLGLGGARRDLATGATSLGTQVSGYVAWTPGASLALRGRASWGSHADAPSSLFAAETLVGLGGTWKPAAGLQADVEAYRRFGLLGATDHVDARAQYTFTGGAAVTARYRLDQTPALAHSGLLSVTVPVGVPLGRRLDVGRLEGRVYDADVPGNPGLAGVVLRVAGQVVTTGPEGTFRFGRVPAGTHFLEVDRGTIGLGRVPLEEMPRVVSVPGGGTATVELGVSDGASLSGRVVLSGFSPTDDKPAHVLGDGAPAETRPAVGVAVVARLAGERHTLVTDPDGAFSIAGLRPGTWQLELPASQVPTFYEIARPRQAAPLAAGGTASVEFVIEPMVRLIHLFGNGKLEVKREEPADPSGPTGALAPRKRAPTKFPSKVLPGDVPNTPAWGVGWEPEVCDAALAEPALAELELAEDECDGRIEASDAGMDEVSDWSLALRGDNAPSRGAAGTVRASRADRAERW